MIGCWAGRLWMLRTRERVGMLHWGTPRTSGWLSDSRRASSSTPVTTPLPTPVSSPQRLQGAMSKRFRDQPKDQPKEQRVTQQQHKAQRDVNPGLVLISRTDVILPENLKQSTTKKRCHKRQSYKICIYESSM